MHAAKCFVTSWHSSFSPLGILSREDDMKALVDSCASVTVTPHKDDFVEYEEVGDGKVLKGITAGAQIKGRGFVHWNVEAGGKTIEVKVRALHVPQATCRLLCPQQLKKELLPKKLVCSIEDDGVRLEFEEGVVYCPYNESNLPELILSTPREAKENLSALNACVMMENNQNLTVAQKELLKCHCRLGHLSLKRVQLLMKSGALGYNPRIKAAANLDLSKFPVICGACAYGKAKRKPTTRSKRDKDSPCHEKELSKEILIPGQKVSMDHFIVSTPGRAYNSRGSDSHDKMFKGGVIFVDHASGYVYVVLVVNFTAGEAIRAKREFEQEMASMGVVALHYHTDNGAFTSAEFQDELAKLNQGLSLSGVGAHHQNAVAERAIGTVVSLARTMMLHSKMRWPKGVSTKLWPMAMKHAEFIVNHVPNVNNVCPLDVVLKTVVPRHQLKNLHVWGSPCYVLDPKLQDGKKIPKFEPRSRQGLNLGWSPKHASTVPLVLNMTTGHISPQFHVLYDDWFTTVGTDAQGDPEPIDDEKWTELLGEERFQVAFDGNEPVELEDEWLSELERVEKHQRAEARVRSRMPGTAPTAVPPSHEVDGPVNGTTVPVVPPANSAPPPSTVADAPLVPAGTGVPAVPTTPVQTRNQTQKIDSSRKQRENPVPETASLPPRRSAGREPGFYRKLAGRLATVYMAASNAPIVEMAKDVIGEPAAFAAMQGFDAVTQTFDVVDYFSYKAIMSPVKGKTKKGNDPDYPTYAQAMAGPDAAEWKEALDKEIETLTKLKAWTLVPRAVAEAKGKKVIKSTWVLRQKRSPDGTPTKKKGRLCYRGDTTVSGVDYEASFSPVVQWSTVRLMLILSIVHGLHTRQVDYVNAFAQSELAPDREIFMELPQGYSHMNHVDCVLQLHKSLYGMVDAPLMFFELLRKNLCKVGFKQYDHIDPCLFVHEKAICITYVDDCLWFSKDEAALDALINEMKQMMELKVESKDVSNFLGIKFTRKENKIELRQDGLIDKVLEATGMTDCNSVSTPAEEKPLGKDPNGKPFQESWNYASVCGMLLYLSGNSRPDLAFAVNQAARFTYAPKDSHAKAIKRICRYLQGTKRRGLVFCPRDDWKVDCYVDADFCGLWGSEDPDDPVVSKSRTGFVITLGGCPLLWKSTLQTETSVSTMMAEYVALSSAMREMLPLKRLVESIAKVVTQNANVVVTTISDVFEDNNGALTVATLPKITPQSKFFAVKLHFFREHVKTTNNPTGEIHIQKINTVDQLADLFTKGLVEAKFTPLRDKLMGWDLQDSDSNWHSRGSVASVAQTGYSVLLALIEEI
jgi:hypothetical protein